MIFQNGWFPVGVVMAAWPVLLVIFALCAKQAWVSVSQHRSAFLVAAVMLPLAWSLNASPESGQLAGMSYHLLALNLTALMLGTSAAFCLGVLFFLPYLWLWGDWHMFPINALSVLLPPLLVNLGFRHWVSRLPANIFIFIFLNGFWAAAVGMVFTGVVSVGLLDWADVFDTAVLWKTAFPVFFLIAWAEAFLSGISTAIFIALKPQWICTFDDDRYLKSAPKIWQ